MGLEVAGWCILPDALPATQPWPQLQEVMGADVDLSVNDCRWLTVALCHRSFLYENAADLPGVGPGALTAFESVGRATLGVHVALSTARGGVQTPAGVQSSQWNQRLPVVRDAIAEVLKIDTVARLGRGERESQMIAQRVGRSTRTAEAVLYQVIGWCCLGPGRLALERLIEGVAGRVSGSQSEHVDDPVTVLGVLLGPRTPTWSYASSGPDHDLVFTATATVGGRATTGTGPSKKVARQEAALSYLRLHFPHALRPRTAPPRVVGRRPQPIALPRGTAARAETLAREFVCADTRPFRLSLIHRSWAYEQAPAGETVLASNAPLGFLGSHLLTCTYFRVQAATLLATSAEPDPERARPLVISAGELYALGTYLDVPSTLALGVGQARLPPSIEMVAGAVQAILAASRLQKADQIEFEHDLPDAVTRFLEHHCGSVRLDNRSRLQRIVNALGLTVTETVTRSGPDHRTAYEVRLAVVGRNGSVTITGRDGSKVGAWGAAAGVVVDATRVLAEPYDDQPQVSRFLIEQAFTELATRRVVWPQWRASGWLGAHHVSVGNRTEFVRWSDCALALADSFDPSEETRFALRDYFAPLRRRAGDDDFRAVLAIVVEWVHTAADAGEQAILDDARWADLAALAAAQSLRLRSAPNPMSLSAVVDDWLLLARRSVDAQVSVPTELPLVPGTTAAALGRILHEITGCVPAGIQRIGVDAVQTAHGISFRLTPAEPWLRRPSSVRAVMLITASCDELRVFDDDRSLTIDVAPAVVRNWIIDEAWRPDEPNDLDRELGRLIHDLKNEVAAARVASSTPTVHRIDALEMQVAALKHIDTASRIARRLFDADRLASDQDLAGETDLPQFLQRWVRAAMATLPSTVRLIPPVHTPARAALGEGALQTILDNLMKNSREALAAAGGDIVVEYLADEIACEVLIDFSDTGPGIPGDVVVAVHRGTAARSRKREGSGIGLVGVRRLIYRLGGEMQPIGAPRVRGWRLMLPAAQDVHGEEP